MERATAAPQILRRPAERGVLWRLWQYIKLFGLHTTMNDWEELYRNIPATLLPWESGKPSPVLMKFVKDGTIHGKVLDVGCGAGTHSAWMAEHGLQVTGVDIAASAISLSRGFAEARGVTIDFRVADARHLPFPEATFDAVFDRGTYHHQGREKAVYIAELRRVLKTGGTYLLLTFSSKMRWPKSVSLHELRENFSDSFRLDWIGEETHLQPDGVRVVLSAVLMTKHHG